MLKTEELSDNHNITVINEAFETCMLKKIDRSGNVTYEPYTCAICDNFVKKRNLQICSWSVLEKNRTKLFPKTIQKLDEQLIRDYTWEERVHDPQTGKEINFEGMMLSPRLQYAFEPKNKRNKNSSKIGGKLKGLYVCKFCLSQLKSSKTPKFAICNGFFFGIPPKELVELNDVELAFISPVKAFGYCFAYTGSSRLSMQLQGTLSFFKVDASSIVDSVAKFSALQFKENIVVLLYGKMTPEQHKKAKRKTEICPDKLLRALEWLTIHHDTYKTLKIDMNSLKESYSKPYLLDHSTIYEDKEYQETFVTGTATRSDRSENNIEQVDRFQIFFPDKTISSNLGGFECRQSFEDFIKKTKLSNITFHLHADFIRKIVPDYKEDNFVNTSLLQFPYGRGGLNEEYIGCDDDTGTNTKMDINEYVKTLSRNSQQHFHYELFVLILYNVYLKQHMLRRSTVQLRTEQMVTAIASNLTMQSVRDAVSSRQRGGPHPGAAYLGACDAVAGTVPHSNKCAKSARRDAEAVSHHFGMPSYMLTVTPDDNYCILVQIYARCIIDPGGQSVSELTDKELQELDKHRVELRIKCPGICAYVFEILMEIIVEKVIGWGQKDNIGMLGKCLAYTLTVEEQGRLSLHAHIQIWIEKIIEATQRLWIDTNAREQRNIRKMLCQEADKHISTKLITDTDHFLRNKNVFPHDCTVDNYINRNQLVLADDQTLRNMRSKHFEKNKEENPFAICPHCYHTWTIEEIISAYLINGCKIPGLTEWPETSTNRLKAMCVEYQREGKCNSKLPNCIPDAAYNVHQHRRCTCFKKRKHICDGECRLNYPRRRRRKTTIDEVTTDKEIRWYKYDGSYTIISYLDILLQRTEWDAFINQSCPYISQSKFVCNTNMNLLLPGIQMAYCFKYNHKNVQEDENANHIKVTNHICNVLSRLERKHLQDRSEAISRVLGGAIMMQSTNIVGAPMASYLTRNDSRFQISHEFVWCPIRDLKTLLEGGHVRHYLSTGNGQATMSCTAMNYLCRSSQLQDERVFEFFGEFDCVFQPSKKAKTDKIYYDFENTQHFQHPSYCTKKNKYAMVLRQKNPSETKLAKIFQYDFPDTASFGGCINDPNTVINSQMELYSAYALILFVPFRQLSDLQIEGSYTKKFREELNLQIWITNKETTFLQNIQDMKANCFRYTRRDDDLTRCTQPPEFSKENMVEDEQDPENEPTKIFTEMFSSPKMQDLYDQLTQSTNQQQSQHSAKFPENLNLFRMKVKGTHRGGFVHLPATTLERNNEQILTFATAQPHNNLQTTIPLSISPGSGSFKVTKTQLVTTLFIQNKTRRIRNMQEAPNDQEIPEIDEPFNDDFSDCVATGAARNIIYWGMRHGLDAAQQKSFQIITAHYILTYYEDAKHDPTVAIGTNRADFLKNYNDLIKLTRSKNYKHNPQLVGLLHGPGGSGKSRVINLVMQYAEKFCENFPEYTFNDRTILVCAYSGVAATILQGETMHSALFINQTSSFTNEQIERFEDTRLVIIDEISFAKNEDYNKLNYHLQILKQKHTLYGGVNILFAGDFRQLEPVGAFPIYKIAHDKFFKPQINAFMELNGKHRFKKDPTWGNILERMREGTITIDDISLINESVIEIGQTLPEEIPIATNINRDRDVKNAAIFHNQLIHDVQQTHQNFQNVLVFAGEVAIVDQATNQEKKCTSPFMSMYQNCCEDDLDYGEHDFRTDPVLKLRIGSQVMVTRNINVSEGQANGTVATVEKIQVLPARHPFSVNVGGGHSVSGIYSNDIDYIELKHVDPEIFPQVFQLKPERFFIYPLIPVDDELLCGSKTREKWKVKITHFPLVLNWATTVHKLQGRTLRHLFIHSWKRNANWIYVALSRCKTRQGLFLNLTLPYDTSIFKPDPDYIKMISLFRTNAVREDLTENDIQKIMAQNYG
jgi:hypothetical protein